VFWPAKNFQTDALILRVQLRPVVGGGPLYIMLVPKKSVDGKA
jgi:hypothetical protein